MREAISGDVDHNSPLQFAGIIMISLIHVEKKHVSYLQKYEYLRFVTSHRYFYFNNDYHQLLNCQGEISSRGKSMKVFLCCSAGMSTSMLVKKMREAADKKNIECTINAYSISEFEASLAENDVCLVAPQVKFQFEEFKKRAEDNGKACGLIDMMSYGMMKGDVVLDQAVSLYQSINNK